MRNNINDNKPSIYLNITFIEPTQLRLLNSSASQPADTTVDTNYLRGVAVYSACVSLNHKSIVVASRRVGENLSSFKCASADIESRT